MAKGKKTGGKSFNSTDHKGGKPKLEFNAIEAKSLTRSEVLCAMYQVMSMPRCDVDELCDKEMAPYASGAQALMASVLSKAITMGCPSRAQFFMSYLFGRPKEYDPTEEEKPFDIKKGLNAIPSDVMIKALHEHEKARAGAIA